jgi:hypothetical protein
MCSVREEIEGFDVAEAVAGFGEALDVARQGGRIA